MKTYIYKHFCSFVNTFFRETFGSDWSFLASKHLNCFSEDVRCLLTVCFCFTRELHRLIFSFELLSDAWNRLSNKIRISVLNLSDKQSNSRDIF